MISGQDVCEDHRATPGSVPSPFDSDAGEAGFEIWWQNDFHMPESGDGMMKSMCLIPGRIAATLVVLIGVGAGLGLSVGRRAQESPREFSASLKSEGNSLTFSGQLLLPSSARQVRSVFVDIYQFFKHQRIRELADRLGAAVLLFRIQGSDATNLPVAQHPYRNAALGGADGLDSLLRKLATDTGHAALADAPVLLLGVSASGGFATTYAALRPERTIAVIRYHSHRRGLPTNVEVVAKIPTLIMAGGDDATAGTDDARQFWTEGRRGGAPWTFLIQPDQRHGEGLDTSLDFISSWIAAVYQQRLSAGGSPLRLIDPLAGWVGKVQSNEILPASSFQGDPLSASWLPDEATARHWRRLAVAPGK
jgi:pimeloyl-ACP methyl ester carboxylesterase